MCVLRYTAAPPCTRRSALPSRESSPSACPGPSTLSVNAEAHTDTTFLTAIPCTPTPGLEILHGKTGRWVRPEAAGGVQAGSDVIILAGEILQVLAQGVYSAAVHRVVRPAGVPHPRVSTPLLLRGDPGIKIPDPLFSGLPGRGVAAARGARASREEDDGDARGKSPGGSPPGVTVGDLWAALQFRVLPSDQSQPVLVRRLREDEIGDAFGEFAPGGLSILSVDPLLVRLRGFATPGECRELVGEASASMSESTTWGGNESQHRSTPQRKSTTTWIPDSSLELLERWTARVSELCGLPPSFMEKWQVRRWSPRLALELYLPVATRHVGS